ncbi:PH domain-containing protein [Caulobacter sp. BP25]|uniref:PH domain-containing protein n=1 Tax=Caulobacter sp. BP25 TaxID=2048900 RepID=UPI0013748398|nr:PH domain-containing protein [Caulobacter sp. BP25]
MYQLNSDFAVTNKRLIAKFGFINRTTIEQRLNKVDTIIVNQGVLGRILNYGKIIVRGTGVSASPFGPIAQPLDFKRAIEEAIEATEAR